MFYSLISQGFSFDIILIFFLVILQSMIGIGILVVGTPVFLILGVSLKELLPYLLPISIVTSFFNIILLSLFSNKENNLDFKNFKYFFLLCIPAIFLGLYVLKNIENLFFINLLVSLVIFFSIFFKSKIKKNFFKLNNFKKKLSIFLIGIIHGITNSGGTILMIYCNLIYKSISNTRYNISFFYFLLALFQYLIFIFHFENTIKFYEVITLLPLILIGVFVGNLLIKKTNINFFYFVINTLALMSAIILIVKTFLAEVFF